MAQPQPAQPDPDLQNGLQFLRAGMFDRAEPLFRSAHGRYGDRPEILHYLAVCLSQRGAFAEAETLWRKAIAKDPKEAMLSYNLGLVGGAGWFAFSSGSFRLLSSRRACWLPRICACGSSYWCCSGGTRSRACAMRTDSSGFAPVDGSLIGAIRSLL